MMKFYWQEICGEKAVAKLNTMAMGCCDILHSFSFWADCLPIYFYRFSTGGVVTNLNNCDIGAVIPESERRIFTTS
jgi:hypothetical protein